MVEPFLVFQCSPVALSSAPKFDWEVSAAVLAVFLVAGGISLIFVVVVDLIGSISV